jgi:hypothetical protein
MKKFRCANEVCRDFGVERALFSGQWFDDPFLCPVCGEQMESTVLVGPPAWYPIPPRWPATGGRPPAGGPRAPAQSRYR